MPKKKIAVLMGGPSSEHEISVRSGLNVLKHLNHKKYTTIPVFIDKRGFWLFHGKNEQPLTEPEALLELQRRKVSLAFLALHGEYGEDGSIQNTLGAAGISFTGSKSLPSALAMHKVLAAREFSRAGLSTPVTAEISKKDWHRKPQEVLKSVYNQFGSCVVIKPVNRGSSVGVSIVTIQKGDLSQLAAAITHALTTSKQIVAQELIRGREVTCGVLDINGYRAALLPTEIIPLRRPFFDYEAKYSGSAREITPPSNMSLTLIKKIEEAALAAHQTLGLSGVTRTDMIVSPGGKIYVLEINTIPGLTEASLIPQQAQACGISFAKLLDLMIEDAILS